MRDAWRPRGSLAAATQRAQQFDSGFKIQPRPHYDKHAINVSAAPSIAA